MTGLHNRHHGGQWAPMGLSSWWVARERRDGGSHWPLAVRVGLLLVIIAFIVGLVLMFA